MKCKAEHKKGGHRKYASAAFCQSRHYGCSRKPNRARFLTRRQANIKPAFALRWRCDKVRLTISSFMPR